MPDLHVDADKPFRVAGRGAFATYRTPSYAGEYQGYGAAASYNHPWVYADLSLAGYRIVRNGLTDHGPGDLAFLPLFVAIWHSLKSEWPTNV